MHGFENQRQQDAITQARAEVERAAAHQLQALQERNQVTNMVLERATDAIAALTQLTAALNDQAAVDQHTILNLDTRYAEQFEVSNALAGQLATAHERIAELQKQGA